MHTRRNTTTPARPTSCMSSDDEIATGTDERPISDAGDMYDETHHMERQNTRHAL